MNATQASDIVNNGHNIATKWSVPPVVSPNPQHTNDPSFVITQGVIYHIKKTGLLQFQIQATNKEATEDATIGISRHGNENGKWTQVLIGTVVKISGDFYLLNQSNVWNITIVPI